MRNKSVNPHKSKNQGVPLWAVFQENSAPHLSLACVILFTGEDEYLYSQDDREVTVRFYKEEIKDFFGNLMQLQILYESSRVCCFFKTKKAALNKLSDMLDPPSHIVTNLLEERELDRLERFARCPTADVQSQKRPQTAVADNASIPVG